MSEREKFERWYRDTYWDFSNGKCRYREEKDDYSHMDVDLAYKAWQAALATRKPFAFGYGIVDKSGQMTEYVWGNQNKAVKECAKLNEPYIDNQPFRVVELFYEDSES
jgi:hypothetical protein